MIRAIRGDILNPKRDGTVEFIRDGVLLANADGRITFVGPFDRAKVPDNTVIQAVPALILPPFIDAHIHIPQHPIRGRFMEGIVGDPAEGRLLAGLNRNVFPAEARCSDEDYARQTVEAFLEDTLANGVVGGSAFMTVHPRAAAIALGRLPDMWSVGVALMDQNCPAYLRSRSDTAEADLIHLAERYGKRAIATDRFAVALSSDLRRKAARIARAFDLPTQTHLNEQLKEKRLVEELLYPHADSYTAVYADDGLLDQPALLAHCIHMRDDELRLVKQKNGFIAHCPTSNMLLGSGIMPLDRMRDAGIEYAICTDVGASPTTSMLCEMLTFLLVHRHRSARATPVEALYRSTLAPAARLGLDRTLGTFEPGMPLTFIEVSSASAIEGHMSANEVILAALIGTSWGEIDEFVDEPDVREGLRSLESGLLDAGPVLEWLSAEIDRNRRRLESRISKVVQNGRETWARK